MNDDEAANAIIAQQQAERDAISERLLNALLDAFPFGLEVDLGSGQRAKLVQFNGVASEVMRPPIYKSDALAVHPGNPEEDIIGYEPWRFSFDFQLENCDQDHVEVTVQITGGGGFA